jgi:hypothetical protein
MSTLRPSEIAGKKSGVLPESDSSSSHTIEPLIPVLSLLQLENSSLEMNLAERLIEAALNDLEATGALQKTN